MSGSRFPATFRSACRAGIACLSLLLAAGTLSGAAAAEPPYPERPISLIVPFGPGGTSDIVARILERSLSAELGGGIVVENKAGAGGAIGMTQLLRSRADGYTIGLSVIGPEVLQPAMRKTGYTTADFEHVCGTYAVPVMMMVTKDSPFRSVADVISYARENPGKLTYGSSGNGTLLHLAMEMLMGQANAKALHVPYKSSGEMVTGLLGQQVMVFNETPAVSRQYGLRPLAVFSNRRDPGYPDVPTMAEVGWPAAEATVWGGLIAPKGVPAPILARLEQACQRALDSDGYKKAALQAAAPATYRNAKQYEAFTKAQSELYGDLIRKLGLGEKQ